ncbi:acetate/propionate family kinase [Neorhizobium sp. JUb45]|uniref:acetate/propionate family kinase n=1 Tax=unclassified Neorhizobium TaxID=2629175 RepID=UPI00104C091B|nr:acetate/propionate family kinase [Neorhizobium sp. JUb45]TCR03248.1 acetate kinase [Neorhizobium sp. JUb45]
MAEDRTHVLVINCGSSSLKFSLFAGTDRSAILSGLAENLGQAESRLILKENDAKITIALDGGSHDAALRRLMAELKERGLLDAIGAVGHRIVHGGERFVQATRLDAEVLGEIEALSYLAPLHNPANVLGVKVAMEVLGWVPHVAVFDTSFHMTIPQAAHTYAIPHEYREAGVRRYGFHGTSHGFVAKEAVELLGLDPENHGLVIAHLGNGSSATAVLNGESVDTSMGLTPLEGLVMGTRSGDIDPGAIFHIARQDKLSIDDLDALLNRKSGLLGLSSLSNDCRTLESAAGEGHEGAILAMNVMVHRLARYIGGLATSLPRLDAVIFTGGIGENSSFVRAKTIARLATLGIKLDETTNGGMFGGRCGVISAAGSAAVAAVIATNEEWAIANEARPYIGQEIRKAG